jgi:hypothetical protein
MTKDMDGTLAGTELALTNLMCRIYPLERQDIRSHVAAALGTLITALEVASVVDATGPLNGPTVVYRADIV